MSAVAAARAWWAARRHSPEAMASGRRATDSVNTTRVAAFLLVLLAGTTIVCAVIGYTATARNDSRLAAERNAALRVALDEFRAAFGERYAFDAGQLLLIERRAGLKDLRFGFDAPAESDREVQSLHDSEGRIIGWFSWSAERSYFQAMLRLWTLVALIGGALAACALLAARAVRWLARSLARATEAVRKLSREDLLTGLPNQRAMLARLDEALAKRQGGGVVVLALVDLDAFREINDSLGRAGGDAVLKIVGEHLKIGLPAGALFGRFEEDAFAVIAAGDDPQIAATVTQALRAALLRPIFLERMWQISASIGIVQAPKDGTDAEELVRRAGLAMRAAKREGRGAVRSFAPEIESAHADRRFLLQELQTAAALQSFDVHYQPIIAADGGAIIGVEALLRWSHPTRGPIPPSVFIPLAEQSGLMSQLGEIVLRRALSDGARWPNISVAINLSPVQIHDRWLVDLVARLMAETGVPSSRVVLEVTEGILIDNPQEAQERLETLRALGIHIALDDFGTGYSSLSYLQKFPFDRLKIDRSFVASLGKNAETGAIIQSIVTLGHALGMTVLAEGVETDEQRVLLRLAGCDEMQGFLFAKPMPAAEFDALLARRTTGSPAQAKA
jgi:diguanylate cyclase (GGDEF)-like protein